MPPDDSVGVIKNPSQLLISTGMARKGGKLLLEGKPNKRYCADQVLEAEGLWAVLYRDRPINIRNVNTIVGGPVKYKRAVFPTPAPAHRLAAKLNAEFKTLRFTVEKLI